MGVLKRPGQAVATALFLLAASICTGRLAAAAEPPPPWQQLEPGIEFAAFRALETAEAGDSLIRVLRVDPEFFELVLLNASATPDGGRLTARQWAERHGLVAAINASLYQADLRTSVSLMVSRQHVNNRRLTRDKAVLAFDRLDDRVVPVQIIDRTCQDFDALRPHYGALVQSIRMIGCDGSNVWRHEPGKWSTAAIGVDRRGRVLFFHVASPYSTRALIDSLLALPLDLKNAMYSEGGREAQLYVHAGGTEMEFVGTHGRRFGSDEIRVALPIPNVVGVRRRASPGGGGE